MTFAGEYQEILTSTVYGIHLVTLGEYQQVSVRISWYSPANVIVTNSIKSSAEQTFVAL